MKCLLCEFCNANEQMKSDGEQEREPGRKKDKREVYEQKEKL
jgi:hypothetical protein